MKIIDRILKGKPVTKKVGSKTISIKQESPSHLRVPKHFRRMERSKRNAFGAKRNDGKTLGSAGFNVIGFNFWNPQAIHSPIKKKFKGWQRENRKYRKAS